MENTLLFVSFLREDSEALGFLKKVQSQCRAFERLGYRCFLYISRSDRAMLYGLNGGQLTPEKSFAYSDKAKFDDRGRLRRKVSSFLRLHNFLRYIRDELPRLRPQKVYIRRIKPITPALLRFAEACRRTGAKTYFEFPDYPVEIPARKFSLSYADYVYDQCVYGLLRHYLHKTVGVSIRSDLNDCRLICIRNGIDLERTPIQVPDRSKPGDQLHLAGVANLGYWHAYDRVIRGLADYEASGLDERRQVYFHMVGDGKERPALEKLTDRLNLRHRVLFYGSQTGEALDAILNRCDVGIGILGNHRRRFFGDSSLKNREYCARGIPFVIAARDLDFGDSFPYKLQVPADDSNARIGDIVAFYDKLLAEYGDWRPAMRAYAANCLTWEARLAPVAYD